MATLYELGESTYKAAQEKFNQSKVENTPRRQRMADGMRQDAKQAMILGELCMSIYTYKLNGGKYMDSVKNKTQVAKLYQDLRVAQYAQKREEKLYEFPLDATTHTYFDTTDANEVLIVKAFCEIAKDVMLWEKEDPKALKIKLLERECNNSKIPGYFPTPKTLADTMVDRLGDIPLHSRFLEPSAGKGDLIQAILDKCPTANIDACEYNYSLSQLLLLKYGSLNLTSGDFLEHTTDKVMDFKEDLGYDYVVMNPPFENKQDIAHITHALKFLKLGGKLVAIASYGVQSNQDAKSRAFRELVESLGGTIELLPQGSFKDSDRSTGVNTVIIEVCK